MVNCYFLHNGLIEYFVGLSFSLLTCLSIKASHGDLCWDVSMHAVSLEMSCRSWCKNSSSVLRNVVILLVSHESKPSCSSTYVVTIHHDQVFLQIILWWFSVFHVSKEVQQVSVHKVKCRRVFFRSICFFGYEILKSSTACICDPYKTYIEMASIIIWLDVLVEWLIRFDNKDTKPSRHKSDDYHDLVRFPPTNNSNSSTSNSLLPFTRPLPIIGLVTPQQKTSPTIQQCEDSPNSLVPTRNGKQNT